MKKLVDEAKKGEDGACGGVDEGGSGRGWLGLGLLGKRG